MNISYDSYRIFYYAAKYRSFSQAAAALYNNQPNVTLVDAKATPIERITPTGLRTTEADYGFDIIVYATGFDALRGAFERTATNKLPLLVLRPIFQA